MGKHPTYYRGFKALFLLLITIIFMLNASNSHARLYKWVDANGATRYGDQLPPEYNNKKHFQLDAEGRIILTKEAGKSPSQIKKERALKKQALEKKTKADKLAKKQRALQNQKDRVLLLTFNSEDDIFYSRDQRLLVLDSKISLLNKNKLSSHKKLTILKEQAKKQYLAKYKKIPGGLQQKIEQMDKKISTSELSITQSKHKRAEVITHFKQDLSRFRDLKARQRKNKHERN